MQLMKLDRLPGRSKGAWSSDCSISGGSDCALGGWKIWCPCGRLATFPV